MSTTLLEDFDRRLNHTSFKSSPLVTSNITPSIGSKIIHQVSLQETERRYKNSEERVMQRLQMWTDVCTMQRQQKFKANTANLEVGKIPRVKKLVSNEAILHLKKSQLPADLALFYNHKLSSRHLDKDRTQSACLPSSYSCDNFRNGRNSSIYSSSFDKFNDRIETESGFEISSKETKRHNRAHKPKSKFDFLSFGKRIQTCVKSSAGGVEGGEEVGKRRGKGEKTKQRSSSSGRNMGKIFMKSMETLTNEEVGVSPPTRIAENIFRMDRLKGYIPKLPPFSNNSKETTRRVHDATSNEKIETVFQYCHTDSLSRRYNCGCYLSKSLDGGTFLCNVMTNEADGDQSWFYHPVKQNLV